MSETPPLLGSEQYDRYRRHLSLPLFGVSGQRRLLAGRVLLIGVGGLGCPLAQYLAAAGVGTLGLSDDDVVDASNLQRQVLYGVADIGRPKLQVASERIRALNPDVEVIAHPGRITSENALEVFEDYDVIVDGTDNFPTRYLSNDACALLGKPNVYGSIFRFEGQASVFDVAQGPCYRCLFPEPPPPGAVPSCSEGGVLGVLPGIIAMIQATETVKILTGLGESLSGRLLTYDALAMEFREFRIKKDPECPLCGDDPSVKELVDYEGFCGIDTTAGAQVKTISATGLQDRMQQEPGMLVLDVREREEVAKARLEGTTGVPLPELLERLGELEAWKNQKVVVLCHLGGRGETAARMLIDHGFGSVENLDGGIEAWSLTVDSGVPRY